MKKSRVKNIIRIILFLSIGVTSYSSYSQNGNVMQFDGVGNYVNLGSNVGNGTRTIEFWFRTLENITPNLSEAKTLIARDGTTNNFDEFNVCFSPYTWSGYGGCLRFTCTYTSSQSFSVYSDTNYWDTNKWYHIAAVIHPTEGLMLFVNGYKQSSQNTSFTTALAANNYITTIGCWGDSYNRFYHGLIDELRFSDVARYQSDFVVPCPEFDNDANTLGLYHFNEKNGTVVLDYSTNFYDGTINGSTYLTEIICNTTQAENISIENVPLVYPNPTASGFFINRQQYKAKRINLVLYNASSQSVLTTEHLNENYIDISSLAPGLYLFVITGENKKILNKGTIIKE